VLHQGSAAEDQTGPLGGVLRRAAEVGGLLVMSGGNVDTGAAERQGYERSRLNAVRHGILSRHLVLPWEDRSEYDGLLEGLVAEHTPSGPTEHHLVEELAGLIWRKQRLVMAEAAAYRAGLQSAAKDAPWASARLTSRALAHLGVPSMSQDVREAIQARPEDTADELAELVETTAMVGRALEILRKGRQGAYQRALQALPPSTFDWWGDALQEAEDPGTDNDGEDDGEYRSYTADAEGLERFLSDEASHWLAEHRLALENRPLIRGQAFGEALDPVRIDRLARYEVHLDRKLERILGMLLKLQELRRTIMPGDAE
jgi:hypothetical protein